MRSSETPLERPRRAFWLHQLAEYVLGVVLIAQGLQSPTPVVPALAGGVVLANAAIARGPLGAFRLVGRRLHGVLDLVVVLALVVAALQPVVEVEISTRLVIGGIAAVLVFVWRQSDFTERSARPASDAGGDRSTELGRLAGRMVGEGINTVRRRTRKG